MPTTQHGYLLIADITGYTAYLSESELEHAQEVLKTLLELLIDHTRPPLTISRLAGDAVISYALQSNAVQGQTFVELIEQSYVAFRRAIELMVLNNTCRCNACVNISSLDLKFFVHYGAFALQRLGGHDELVGSDVNLIHRLLTNRVAEATGVRAYTLYSDPAIVQLGLQPFCARLIEHHEEYEHLGRVKVWVQDMHLVWQEQRETTRVTIPADQISVQAAAEVDLPAELVWDRLIQPEYRALLMGSDRQAVLNQKDGRVAPGSIYQCFHGDRVITQTILDWQPFERMLSEDLVIPKVTVLVECRLVPTATGVRLVQTLSKSRGPFPMRLMVNRQLKSMFKEGDRELKAFLDHIAAELEAPGSVGQTTHVESHEVASAVAASLLPAPEHGR